jgi:hypothetical protein
MRARRSIAGLGVVSWVVLAACEGRTDIDAHEEIVAADGGLTDVAPHADAPTPTSEAPTSCECIAGEIGERTCEGAPTATERRTCDDGCHFSPWSACAGRGWIRMASPRSLHLVLGNPRVAAWTGREMFFWSGNAAREYADTAAYDPATDRWRLLARSPLTPVADDDAARAVSHTVADGRIALLEAGYLPSPRLHFYDPDADAWSTRVLDDFPVGSPVFFHALRWVRSTREIVALRGDRPTTAFAISVDTGKVRVIEPPRPLGTRAAFIGAELWICCSGETWAPPKMLAWDPIANTWRTREDGDPTAWFSAMFTLHDGGAPALFFLQRPSDVGPELAWGGSMWSSIDDTFVPVPQPPLDVLPVRARTATLWSSDRSVFVWGGTTDAVQTGASFDLATRRWRTMPLGGPNLRDAVTVWTGDLAILFGGDFEGMRFRP